jgi:hypothetical protein
MSFEVPPPTTPPGAARTPSTPRPAPRAEIDFAAQLGIAVAAERERDEIPSSPPPEVRAQVAAAARRHDELAAAGRRLHFDMGDDGRVRVEVHDDEGLVLRQIPLSEALDVALGRPLR